MKRLKSLFLAAALVLVLNYTAIGADVGTHVITFNFQAINEIEITGAPNLTIDTATAGEEPQTVTDSSCTFAISTNGTNKRITASIDTAMPAYVTLKVNVAAPSGSGASLGDVILSTSATDIVAGIGPVADSSSAITYKLSATVEAGIFSINTRTVTFTLSD